MRKFVKNITKKAVALAITAAVALSGLLVPTDMNKVNAQERIWVVTLDPGHGGYDSGAVGGGLLEKNCNLSIAQACKSYIESHSKNIKVYMTRNYDSSVGLYSRAPIAAGYDSDLFVSLHNNSSTNSASYGAEVWIPRHFYNKEMNVFGNDVLNNINAATGISKRYVRHRDCTNDTIYTLDEYGRPNGEINPHDEPDKYAAYSGDKSNTVLADYYGVINSGVSRQMPCCIIEHAYISNPGDNAKLANAAVLKALGEADAKAIIKYFESGVKENEEVRNEKNDVPEVKGTEPGIAVKAHVQNIGWMDWKYDGAVSGTSGRSLRVEAFKLYPYNMPEGATIKARAHIQNLGWQSYTINANTVGRIGTSGRSLRIEALELTLNGVPGYELEYRVHIQNFGWSKWVSQGEPAGTSGLSYRLEAAEIRVVKSDQKQAKVPYVTYRSHVQNKGWLEWVPEGSFSGTSGQSLRMESVQINLHNPEPGMYISGRVHVQNKGWIDYDKITPSTLVGTSGQSLRVESLNLKLNGTDKYKLQYRVHIQNIGWTGWIDEGKEAGTHGRSLRLEGIQIRVVEK